MAQQPLPINTFQLPNGAPVANGSITVRLNTDGMVSGDSINTKFAPIALDSNGVIAGSPVFWPNSEISPIGTYYIVIVYTAAGQEVAGSLLVVV